jgi:hypothetical protein
MEYTLEKFKSGIEDIETYAELKKSQLIAQFALANNPYKIGDIVTDHIGSLLIEKIKVRNQYNYNKLPDCLYFGIELKKDGTPKIRQDKDRRIFQSNIILE